MSRKRFSNRHLHARSAIEKGWEWGKTTENLFLKEYNNLTILKESIATYKGYLKNVGWAIGVILKPACIRRVVSSRRQEGLPGFLSYMLLWVLGLLLFILASLLAYNRSSWLFRAYPVIVGFVAIEVVIGGQWANLFRMYRT